MHASVGLLAFAISLTPLYASAEYYSKLGYSSDDVGRYKMMSASIDSCKLALATDPHDLHSVDVKMAPMLARLYGLCRKALEARHASIGVLRVNDTLLGTQCLVISASGLNAGAIQACNLKPYLPSGGRGQ